MNLEKHSRRTAAGSAELSHDGTVLYYKPDATPSPSNGAAESGVVVGRNFFNDIVRAANAGEFSEEVSRFRWSRAPSRAFDFTFRVDGGAVPVSVVFARMREQTEAGGRESIFVRLRPA